LGAGLRPDPRRFAAGLRQPGGVTRQGGLSVGLNLLGPLNTALNLLGPLGQHRVEPGKHVLLEPDCCRDQAPCIPAAVNLLNHPQASPRSLRAGGGGCPSAGAQPALGILGVPE